MAKKDYVLAFIESRVAVTTAGSIGFAETSRDKVTLWVPFAAIDYVTIADSSTVVSPRAVKAGDYVEDMVVERWLAKDRGIEFEEL